MRFPTALILSSIAFLVLLSATPIHAMTQVEGRVGKSAKPDGRHDMILQVWERSTPAGGKVRLLQTIRIARVEVVDGAFKMAIDGGLETWAGRDLVLEIQTRPFEAFTPYQPGEVSRVLTAVI